jgi:hypothetical protein
MNTMKKGKTNQVGNFEQFVSFCTALGSEYDPSMDSIKVSALEAMLVKSKGSLEAADVSRTAYVNALNARQPVFNTISALGSRIIGALKGSGVPPELLEDAKLIRRRFYSQAKKEVRVITSPAPSTQPGAPAAATLPTEEVKFQRKLSQLDKDSMIANFNRLVKLVASEPRYKPNEVDLRVSTLSAFVTQLRKLNADVINSFMAMQHANQALDKDLYEDGIYALATAAKGYIESVFGTGSEKHRQATKLQFRKR